MKNGIDRKEDTQTSQQLQPVLLNEDWLYNRLFAGKITLKEYLQIRKMQEATSQAA